MKKVLFLLILIIAFIGCSSGGSGSGEENKELTVSLTAPSDNAANVETTVTFSWNVESNSSYEAWLYIDTQEGFSSNDLMYIPVDNNSYEVENLKYSTEYYWKVVVTSGEENKSSSVRSFQTKTNTSPEVSGISIPDNSTDVSTETTLSWSGSDDDGDTLIYDVYFGTSEGSMQKVLSDVNVTAYTPDTLDFETTYYWKVVVKDGSGEEVTYQGEFTTLAEQNYPPNAAEADFPKDNDLFIDLDVTLEWTGEDANGDTLTYNVYFGKDSNPSLILEGTSQNSYTPENLEYSTTYYWKIESIDEEGEATTSAIWRFTTTDEANSSPEFDSLYTSPENLATDVDVDVQLIWLASDPDGDDVTYTVYFGENNGSLDIIETDITSTSADPGNLEYSTAYSWKVTATDEKNDQTTSEIWTFTTGDKPNTDPVISSIVTPANDSTDIGINQTLSWNATDAEDDQLTYDVYFGESGSELEMKLEGVTASTYTPDELLYSTIYNWKIVAKDGNGGEAESSVFKFTTMSKPNTAPAIDSVIPANDSTNISINQEISWVATDADGDTLTYDIYFSKSSSDLILKQEDINVASYDPGTLSYATSYKWKLVAKDGNGGETESIVYTFTTESMPDTAIIYAGKQYNGYTGGGTGEPRDSNWAYYVDENSNNIAEDDNIDFTEPSERYFAADAFFTIKGSNNNIGNAQYSYIKVKKDGSAEGEEETVYFTRGNFEEKIWLRYGSGDYTIEVFVTYITESNLNYEGDILKWTYYLTPLYTFNVTNTRNEVGKFLYPSDQIQSAEPQFKTLADSIISGAGANNVQDKARAIHDYVVKYLYYDDASLTDGQRKKQDAISALNNKTAVCEGYTSLYNALLRSVGIEVKALGGVTLDVSIEETDKNYEDYGVLHAWSAVDSDGTYFQVDTTWDDPGLQGDPPGPGGADDDSLGGNLSIEYFWKNTLFHHKLTEERPDRAIQNIDSIARNKLEIGSRNYNEIYGEY